MKISLKTTFVLLLLATLIIGGGTLANAADGQVLAGKVVESMDSGGYTYVQIENSGKKTWVAVPKTKIEIGQDIAFSEGAVMNNFESKTLKRRFDTIIFSGGVVEKAK